MAPNTHLTKTRAVGVRDAYQKLQGGLGSALAMPTKKLQGGLGSALAMPAKKLQGGLGPALAMATKNCRVGWGRHPRCLPKRQPTTSKR